MPSAPPIKIVRGNFQRRSVNYRIGHLCLKVRAKRDDPQDAAAVISDVLHDALVKFKYHLVSPPRRGWAYVRFAKPYPDILPLIQKLSRDKRVIFADPDLMMVGSQPASPSPQDPYFLSEGEDKFQWGVHYINLPEVWEHQTGNDSVLIGLVDSGVLLLGNETDSPGQGQPLVNGVNGESLVNHEDLDGSRFLAGYNYVEFDPPQAWPHDINDYYHGTTMAGVMAAWANNKDDNGNYLGMAGVNWGSDVYVCRALDPNKISTIGMVASAVGEILDFASIAGKKVVINLSINQKDDVELPTWALVLTSLVEADAIICISAGNIIKMSSEDPVTVYQPARMAVESTTFSPHVIVVGAFGLDEDSQKPFLYQQTGQVIEDMVFSPGVKVLTTSGNPAYSNEYGTSLANAHVSGLAALIWSHDSNIPATDIVQCIKSTCKVPTATLDPEEVEQFGISHGIIDAMAAYQATTELEGPPGPPGQPVQPT